MTSTEVATVGAIAVSTRIDLEMCEMWQSIRLRASDGGVTLLRPDVAPSDVGGSTLLVTPSCVAMPSSQLVDALTGERCDG